MAGKTHHLGSDKVHYRWDKSTKPALEIEAGDTVVFELREVSDGQITPNSKAEDLRSLDFDKLYPLAGPVYVRNAEPNDTLEVEILSLTPKNWGWTGFLPELGLLSEDFSYTYIKHWDLSNHKTAELRLGVVVPLDPFCGVMGVAPREQGSFHPLPPGTFGGNMDIRHLNAGNILLLPVWNEGALFSCGDCHSAQGDGEVCVTGIESPMEVQLRFNIIKNRSIPSPQFMTKGPLTSKYDSKGYHATTGISNDLMNSAKLAVRGMIDYLTSTHHLTRDEAYVLCSVAADLKISEIVDKPNWIVSCYVPLSVFLE